MRADARANREAIVAAANRQVAAHGVDVSLSAVADDAGVGIATLYRNFPNREDLVSAVLVDLESRMMAIIERAGARIEQDPVEGWQEFAHAVADLRPGALVSAFAAQYVTGDRVPQPLEEQRNRALTAVQRILDQAKHAGVVRADLTAVEFQMGIASITRPLPDVAVPQLAQHEAWLVDVYLRGLRA